MAKRNLSKTAVVSSAAELADETGYHQLTLAAVAERLEVAPPSLYQHVAGLEDLKRELAAAALWEFGDALRSAALGRARGDALSAVAETYRQWAGAHPGRYAATVEAADLDNPAYAAAAQRPIEVLTAVLRGYGLVGDEAVDAMRAIRSTLHGFVDLESRQGFGLPQMVERSFERLVTGLDDALKAWAEPDKQPERKVQGQ